MHRIPVRQIMKTDVITIHPEDLAADAAQLMTDFNIRRLPVVDENDCLVGIVTDSDVREAEMAGSVLSSYEPNSDAAWLTAADIMTREVITITADATIGQLVSRFIEHKIGGVPVVEVDPRFPKRDHLVGIVTETDIFRMIAEAWEQEAAAGQTPSVTG